MPIAFYLTCLFILIFGIHAWMERKQAWGLPVCMVLGTVSVWYIGDVLYNKFDIYLETIGEDSLVSAWWQVLWFVISFGVMVQPIHRLLNRRWLNKKSHVISYLESNRLRRFDVQCRIDQMGKALLFCWICLMVIGLILVKGDIIGLFAPYLGEKADPWSRPQIGGGFSALISLAAYLQVFLAAAFGVLAAVSFHPKTRYIALFICFLTLPYFIFDRTRNTMLATVIPGVLAYVFLRLRISFIFKIILLIGAFLIVNFWFTFVMANRGQQSIAGAFYDGLENSEMSDTKHEGLNMLEELAWIDHFFVTGSLKPNYGNRYFAELVNPVPRVIWKNKPTIGLDYAIARGQGTMGSDGTVTATISTGMIGQGVVNFGRIFGPLAAAFLMSLWVATLARQDLLGHDPGRLILYGCGLILTFNMGRDITFLVVYPFIFGLIMYHFWKYYVNKATKNNVVNLKKMSSRKA